MPLPSPELIAQVTLIGVVFMALQISAAVLVYMERKVAAFVQQRYGPYLVGPRGALQPLADILKLIMKEELRPKSADTLLFYAAPVLSATAAFAAFAVVPFGADTTFFGLLDRPVSLAVADVNVGLLVIFAITSMGVYGIVLAGWASNSKYSLLGGLRSSAQMISYEISMGMSTIPVLILAGNVSLSQIVQQQGGWGIHWNVINCTIAFIVFMIAAFAETNRVPFDLPEAESELVAGYHAEYSAMKFSMFFIAEYANIMTASALMATLFFGGWDIPFTMWDNVAPHTFLKTLVTFAVFWAKILFFVFVFIWVRWTLPRFRYDQLMALGWKFMLPVSLTYVVVVAGATLILESAGIHPASWQFALIMLAINVVLVAVMFGIVDRGRLVSPAYSRLDKRNLDKVRRLDAARMRPITSEGGAD